MAIATYTLYDADSTDYDFGALGTLTDSHNYLYIAALWLGSGLIYFLDMQIWWGEGGEVGESIYIYMIGGGLYATFPKT